MPALSSSWSTYLDAKMVTFNFLSSFSFHPVFSQVLPSSVFRDVSRLHFFIFQFSWRSLFRLSGSPNFHEPVVLIFRRLSQFSAAVMVTWPFGVLAVRPRVSIPWSAASTTQFISSQRFTFGPLRACPAAFVIWIVSGTLLLLLRDWLRHPGVHSVVLVCRSPFFRKFFVSIVEFFQFSMFL